MFLTQFSLSGSRSNLMVDAIHEQILHYCRHNQLLLLHQYLDELHVTNKLHVVDWNWVNPIYEDEEFGLTALIVSCREGHLDVVKYLLQQGCDVDLPSHDESKDTALMHAIRFNHVEIVQYLMEFGANVNLVESVSYVFVGDSPILFCVCLLLPLCLP